jgi:hypothetical protein
MRSFFPASVLLMASAASAQSYSYSYSYDCESPTVDSSCPSCLDGKVYANVLGQSGKIRLGVNSDSGDAPTEVTINMDAMREVDSDGNSVGTSGSTKHSINTFASQDFDFSEVEGLCIGPNEDIPAQGVAFMADGMVDGSSSLRVDLFMILGDGEITNGDETMEVTRNMFKWSITVADWKFCGDPENEANNECKSGNKKQTGAALELDVEIKGLDASPTLISDLVNEPQYYTLGDETTLSLSKVVYVDGEAQTMEAGYPKVTAQGSKSIFTFKFPKGELIEYDPGLDFGAAAVDPTDAPTPTPPTPGTDAPTAGEDDATSAPTDEEDEGVDGSASGFGVSAIAVVATTLSAMLVVVL